MKENKNVKIEVRLTPREKEKIKVLAEKYNLTVSEMVRLLCKKAFWEAQK